MAMDALEYDYTVHSRQNADDDKLAIRFFRKAKQDPDRTAAEGRPIFVENDYIQIMNPGDRNVHIRPIRPLDMQRFARQYEHWKKTQQSELVIGSPIEMLGLTLAQVEEYRYFGVRTVEQMAELRDDVVGKIMGATALKQKAAAFLQILKDEAPLKKVQAELDKRDSEIDTLKAAVAEQSAIIKQLQTDRKR